MSHICIPNKHPTCKHERKGIYTLSYKLHIFNTSPSTIIQIQVLKNFLSIIGVYTDCDHSVSPIQYPLFGIPILNPPFVIRT